MELPENFCLLVDQKISLKCLEERESESLFKLVDENRTHLRAFLGWLDQNTSSLDSLEFIQKEKEKLKAFLAITLGIYLSGRLIGLISLQEIDSLNQNANIGYWIAEKEQGKGVVTKSAEALIKYAFRELKLHRIEILVAPHNEKSRKVPQKLGFFKEGVLKEAVAHYGKYFDAELYALINK